jgi:hypothetical protein
LFINFLSLGFTAYAILKIFATAKELARCNNKVQINSKTMIVHSVILTFNSAAKGTYVVAVFAGSYISEGIRGG